MVEAGRGEKGGKDHGDLLHFNAAWGVQFSSVTQLCPTLCYPMDCSTPGFSVYHQLPEPIQTHVHHVGDAIQQSHPLLESCINTR